MRSESPGLILWKMRQQVLRLAAAKGWTAAHVDEWSTAMFGVPLFQLRRRYVEAMLIHLTDSRETPKGAGDPGR